MKVECLKEKLADAVSKAEKLTGKNLTLPVLKCILLEAKDNTLTIKSTNLDLGVEISFPVKVERVGTVAVPGVVLNSFIQNLQNQKNISLEVQDTTLLIKTSTNSTSIKTIASDDFPTIPRLGTDRSFKIHTREILEGLKAVWYSAAASSMKPELSSVYIYPDEDSLVFVATDSFRLAEKRVKQKKTKDGPAILLPHKNIPEIIKILDEVNDEVDMAVTKNQISFTYKGLYLTSRIIDGVFPDYKQILPKECKTEAIVLKQDLINTLKLTHVFSDNFNQVNFKILPSQKTFELKTKNAELGETVNNINSSLTGEDLEINFNHKYIADCFGSINTDSVSLDFNGLARPMVIRGVNDKTFLYLVMPMNK
jgi:DNA polymerase-3 subunit beta